MLQLARNRVNVSEKASVQDCIVLTVLTIVMIIGKRKHIQAKKTSIFCWYQYQVYDKTTKLMEIKLRPYKLRINNVAMD